MREEPVAPPSQALGPERKRLPAALLAGSRRRHPFLWFVARRLVAGVVLLVVASMLVFLATDVLPGDAATALLGKKAAPETLQALREKFDLDKPLVSRYTSWVGGLVQGDLAESFAASRPVTEVISRRAVNSLILGLVAALVMLPVSLALGVLTGIRPGRPTDHAVTGISLTFIAVPEFVTGTLLIILFGVTWKLFPVLSLVPAGGTPFENPKILVLPVLTLTFVGFAYMVRMIRAGVTEAMSTEYVEMARLRGIAERRVVLRHALKNALAPSVQVFALTLQWLVGGLIIVETLFAYPGIGLTLVNAVAARDIPVVQGVAILIAALYIAINIIADLIVVLLIPRLRTTV